NIELCEEPAYVHGDESKLEQVLMNLVLNAGEAMPDGGTVTLKTGIHQILRSDSTSLSGEKSALLMVRDTGKGISTDDQDRIFDPFFSTKDDSGTGLGLSTVYGIVKQHGGEIDVESEVGSGTTFRILLPFSHSEPVDGSETRSLKKDSSGELIMVVEDSPQVRDVTEKALAAAGYKAVCADSGEEALELLETLDEKPDLMLTDVIMPGMSATELRLKVRRIIPELKVIYMSGYSDDIANEKDENGRSIPFIQKPFTSNELIRTIEEVLKNR
ncbi:MAG: response regulator, partial [Candidatus Aegiribacteria sp.]|nr:response regulator [Candidatus Aegiribacteria sp.]